MTSQRSRGWCFTINNYGFKELIDLMALPVDYMIFGFEKGKKGTPHVQGYAYFSNKLTFNKLKKYLPTAHVEAQRGPIKKAIEYCKKEGEFYEFGDSPHPGQASFEQIEDVMQDPQSNFHLYNMYRRSYDAYKLTQRPDPRRDKNIYMIDEKDKYTTAHLCESSFMDRDIETYVPVHAMFVDAYTSFRIDDWYNGFPPRVRRGFEIIDVDPNVVFIMYSTPQERGYIMKRYSHLHIEKDSDEFRIKDE